MLTTEDKQSMSILIVDDEPKNIQLVGSILKEEGFDVEFALSGEEALDWTESKAFDLLLLDIMMPGIGGYEVCRRLSSDDRSANISIIFFTAMGKAVDEAKGLELGAVDYIVKPVSPSIVKARVNTHLELKKKRNLLNRFSLVDALTGIANKQQLDHTLHREWRRANREGTPLSLAFVDIDFFQLFNDEFGRKKGDDCIRKVAGAILNSVRRPGDLAARYDGCLFAALLANTDDRGLKHIAGTLQSNVRTLDILNKTSPISDRLTLSVGGATRLPRAEITLQEFTETVKSTLRKAQKSGNTVIAETIKP